MQDVEATSGSYTYEFVKDPVRLTQVLKTLLWISLGIFAVSLISDGMQLNLLLSGSISKASAVANDVRQHLAAMLRLLALLVTAITFLIWVHRANKNCNGFANNRLEFSPGWAVGYYFVPVVNLYLPYKAMKEIWRVSTDPVHWRSQSGSLLLVLWWMLWIVSNITGYVVAQLSLHATTLVGLRTSTKASILFDITNILLYIAAIAVVVAIFARQQKLVGKTV